MPVIHIPTGVGPNGMPVGLSLVCRRYDDQLFLHVAAALGRVLC